MPPTPSPEDYAHSRLVSYAAFQWPGYKPAPHHRLIARHLEAVERGDITRLMIFMPPRSGKALAVDTPIPTPTGWKRIDALRPGDEVFNGDGLPCRVLAVSPIWKNREVFSVTTHDGERIVADGEHEWVVRLCRKRPVFKPKTTQWLAARNSERSAMIAVQGCLQLPTVTLLVPPYVLGAWLGDGTSLDAAITQSPQDAIHVIGRIQACGYEITKRSARMLYGVLGLRKQLRELGLIGNKHIPPIYLRASREQRVELLQGLIDTDGYVSPNGHIEFTSCDASLAGQVQELVSSLGYKASLNVGWATIDGRHCGLRYRVMFYMASAASLPRKAALCRNAENTNDRYLTVEPCGVTDTICIQIDSPCHTFLCGRSMLRTHNSMLVSEFFPAWYLGRNPSHYVIAATYAQDLADDFGRKVRNQISEASFQSVFPGCKLKGDSQSSKRFHITKKLPGETLSTELDGAYFATGIGGPMSGRGAHLLLIDDPTKNREEAESAVYRQRNKDWFTSTAYTRLMPNGKIIVVMTRWHGDDLAGWLSSTQAHENWTILSLPAIAEIEDEIGRQPGDALWPDAFPPAALEKIKLSIGSRDWSALYQQRPAPAEGGIFKTHWFKRYATPEESYLQIVQSWDTAIKAAEINDPSCCTTWGVKKDGYDLLQVLVKRLEYPDLKNLVIKQAEAFDADAVLIEDKASGQQLLQDLKRTTTLPLIGIMPINDKITRASAVSAMVEAGNVFLPTQAAWLNDYEMELMTFPNAPHNDQVDSTTQFLNWMRSRAGSPSPRLRSL